MAIKTRSGDILEIRLKDMRGKNVFYKDKCDINDQKGMSRILNNISEMMNLDLAETFKQHQKKREERVIENWWE